MVIFMKLGLDVFLKNLMGDWEVIVQLINEKKKQMLNKRIFCYNVFKLRDFSGDIWVL